MSEFVIKSNLFGFNSIVFPQVSGSGIGTKLTYPYVILHGSVDLKILRYLGIKGSSAVLLLFIYLDGESR